MKNIKLLAVSLSILIVLSSCGGSMGPTGPAGKDASSDLYSNIFTTEFTIQPRDWVKDGSQSNKWTYKKSIPIITSKVELEGFVLIYMKAQNAQTWIALPYTYLDRDTKGNFFSTELSSWWGVGQVEVQLTDTHPTTPMALDYSIDIKVVSVRDVAPNLMPSKKDYSNYEQTKKILNLKD